MTVAQLAAFDRQGCTLVDTTCGSVLNVWKAVRRYAEDGFTSVIHGKIHHEETRATASQALKPPSGPYLVVLDRDEAADVCRYIRDGGDRGGLPRAVRRGGLAGLRPGPGPGAGRPRQPDDDADDRVARDRRDVPRRRWPTGTAPSALAEHYRAFDTICSATQDRQDAVVALLRDHPVDLMVVVGGYNSSNTLNLARICAARVPTYHVADDDCLVSADEIRHRPVGSEGRGDHAAAGCPPAGPLRVGLTAGASTPDNLVGAAILKIAAFADRAPAGTR